MPPVGFETTISAGERSEPYALDHTATGTCGDRFVVHLIKKKPCAHEASDSQFN
jgi:hypothetical protein